MGNEKRVPVLRFPGFKGEWESCVLGDVASFSKGKGISKADITNDGRLECIRYGELYTHYGETIDEVRSRTHINPNECVLSEPNDVIIPASGESEIDIARASCVLREGVALGGDLNIIKSSLNGIFLSYYLNNKKKGDIATLAQGISVVHLYAKQLKTLRISVPVNAEQQRIASFLSSVDDKIQQLQKKKELLEQYKKGVMQRIFNQDIRFEDDEGSQFPKWTDRLLGDLLDYEQPTNYIVKDTEYDQTFETPVLTAGKSFILGYTDEKFGIFQDSLPVIIFDDFTTASQFVNFPFKVKSSAMKILKSRENQNIKFIYEAMQNIVFETGGHGRHWISVFSQISLPTPTLREQTKIADFLSSIDDKINLVNKQLDLTKQFKKGLLQQMFV